MALDYISSLILDIPLPYATTVRKISRIDAIQLSKEKNGEGLIKEIVSIMQTFHPLVEFVNS